MVSAQPAISDSEPMPTAANGGAPTNSEGRTGGDLRSPDAQSAPVAMGAGSFPQERLERPVVFFDGVCGLCNRWVDFLIVRDRRHVFQFAPLQGETSRERLNLQAGQPLNSVVLVDERGEHRKSDAIWRMLVRLGGGWRIAGWLLRIIPSPIRNRGYDLVAHYRYRLFGQKESCRLPTREERERFLP